MSDSALLGGDAVAVEEQGSMLSTASCLPEPDTISKIVRRLRAMTIKLLPVEVDLEEIQDAKSATITVEVINAFSKAAGDFAECIPFCLLRARQLFLNDAYAQPADFDENMCRATACEVLARRIVHNSPVDRLESVMSTRFRFRESDGDPSAPISALESAIDQRCTIFLSSSEAQHVVNSLWRGDWVQKNNENDDIDYVPYNHSDSGNFWDHLDPERLAVPRYQTAFRIVVWIIYLFVYSQTVRSPLDAVDPEHNFDEWEFVLYLMTTSFLIEEATRVIKTIKLSPKPLSTIGFWTIVNFTTDALLLTAFSLRMAGLRAQGEHESERLQLKSFQVLSCVAPLIWMKLLTVFDGFQIIGVVQVVVFRMLRESAIFFILLGVIVIGFAQSLFALDAADGESDGGEVVINALVQALIGSPDFDSPNQRFGYPYGLIVYYVYNFLTTIVLVNLLVALLNSAYSDVEATSVAQYMTFFAHKTISLTRAPDSFVYPAPFNLIEAVLIAPLEYVLPKKVYIQINRVIMSVIFFIPLMAIALFESQMHHTRSERLRSYFNGPAPEEEGDPETEDPKCTDEDGEICRISFKDLTAHFPNTALTPTTVIHRELIQLRRQLDALELEAHGKKPSKDKDADEKAAKEEVKETKD